MNNLLQDIRMQFSGATALYRLLAINVVLFLAITIVRTVFFLGGADTEILNWFIGKMSLPASMPHLVFQPWSLISYMFLHTDFLHILFNLLVFYWSGRLFTEYLGNDKLWATYVLGALCGALFYLLAFNIFPAFALQRETAHLMGASAGVIAVMVAIATLLPDYTIFLLVFGAVRLKYVALVSIILYFISIPLGNAGGHIAHLGGAFFGYFFIRRLRSGQDLSAGLIALSRFRFKKKAPMQVVRTTTAGRGTRNDGLSQQEIIDRILDKINKSGFDSLSRDEKDILYKASGRKGAE